MRKINDATRQTVSQIAAFPRSPRSAAFFASWSGHRVTSSPTVLSVP
ncbi:hypothetical protein [Caballeronia sp. S22]